MNNAATWPAPNVQDRRLNATGITAAEQIAQWDAERDAKRQARWNLLANTGA